MSINTYFKNLYYGDKMKKVFLLIILVFGFINVLYAKDNSVKISPQKPKPGDEVTITYNPEGTPFANAGSMEMRVYPWSNNVEGNLEKMSSVEMKKEGQVWSGKFKSTNMTDIAVILFVSDNKMDNNERNGYFVNFYNNDGSERPGTKIGHANAISSMDWARNILNHNLDFKKAKTEMEEAFKADPSLKKRNFDAYILVLLLSNKEDKAAAPAILKNEVDWFAAQKDLTDDEYEVLVTDCKKFRMAEKEKEVTEQAVSKYPKGKVAFMQKIESIAIDNNAAAEIEKLDKEFPEKRESDEYRNFVRKAIDGNKVAYLKDIVTKNTWLIENQSICTYILNGALTLSIDPQFLQTVNGKFRELINKALSRPLSERENTVSEKQEAGKRQMNFAYSAFLYGKILGILHQTEKAADAFEEAAKIIPPEKMSAKYFEWYVQNLIESSQFEKAGKLIETSIKLGKATEKVKALSKDYYVRKQGSEAGYEDYYAGLTGKAKNKLEEDLKGKLTNKPAPEFMLKDFNGKEVKLSDFKGKTVILDFWATWCGFCKASFPSMKKLIEKYAGNANIKFVFVDTFERIDNPVEAATKYLKDNDYPFYVLSDKENKVAELFGVKGIPAKVFIDKYGNQRLFSAGFNEAAFVDEIDYMINLLK
jgi:thiol-disulfide isomerase/thioredoxin